MTAEELSRAVWERLNLRRYAKEDDEEYQLAVKNYCYQEYAKRQGNIPTFIALAIVEAIALTPRDVFVARYGIN